MTPSLAGRSIAVTGATRGIGYAVAKQLLADGSAVAVCGREPEAVQRAVAALQAECGSPERVFGQAADVTHDAQMSAFAQASLDASATWTGSCATPGFTGPRDRSRPSRGPSHPDQRPLLGGSEAYVPVRAPLAESRQHASRPRSCGSFARASSADESHTRIMLVDRRVCQRLPRPWLPLL